MKKVAVMLPVAYRGGSLRSAKSLAKAIAVAAKEKNESIQVVFSYLKNGNYDLYTDSIYRYIYFKVGQDEEARDLTSEVFLKAWNYIQDNKITDYKTLKALFYKIARNLVIDHYRRKSNNQR